MKANRLGLLAGLGFALAGSAQAADKAADKSQPVASVGGTPVTSAELDAHLANLPFQARQQHYQMRKQLLDDLINRRLQEKEAAARKVSVDELVRLEVDAKVPDITDAEAKEFYDKNKARFGPTSEADAIAQIKTGLKGQRVNEKKQEFVNNLRAKGGVKILLEPPRLEVASDGEDPAKGPAAAPVTIVEFSDFQCPFCSRVLPTLKKIEETYGDKVRIVFRDLPLLQLHPNAAKAAEAGQCANEQGKFWEMHDKMFANQQALGVAELKKYAVELGMKPESFDQCLDSAKHEPEWKKDAEDAQKYGLSGTPGFFINGRMLDGARPYEMFAQIIDEELDLAAAKSPAKATVKPPAPPVKK
jgi:protein-disulfide isomerase